MGGIQRIRQIFNVQIDAEARLEVTIHHHRCLGIQHGAARKTTANGLIDQIRINARFGGQRQCFGHGRDVQRHNHLVCQLGDVACANFTGMHHGASHGFHQVVVFVEHGFIAPHHHRQSTVDGFRFATADRRIQHLHAFRFQRLANFAARQRGDRTHVDHHQARLRAVDNAVLTQRHLFHVRGVWQHGDNDIALLGDRFCSCRRFCASRNHFCHRV